METFFLPCICLHLAATVLFWNYLKTVNMNNVVRERMAFASWIRLKCLFTEQVIVLLQILEINRTIIK